MRRSLVLAPLIAIFAIMVGGASAATPKFLSLGQVNRHPQITFSAPRASNVIIYFATKPDRATDGHFLSENVVHTGFLTDDEIQAGRWLDEDQLDPARYFVMLDASAESSCTSFPPPDYDPVLDPACADGFSEVATLDVPKPPQRYTGRVEQLRYIRIIYLTLKVNPLGERLAYKVCWQRTNKRRACVSASVPGYDWNSSADDMVSVSSRAMPKRTTFTWFVGARKVASKTVRVLRP